ncbi:MAG: hypothetical protein H7301_07545, partial [Cryobacterium sp.]|nr:hypothetical protein [Oligoflexia bacterium]
ALPFWFAKDPVRMSWMVNADLILLYLWVLFLEIRNIVRVARMHETLKGWARERSTKFSLLVAAFVHLLVTTIGDSGDYHRWGNGMRYSMPIFFLLVILWEESWTPKWLARRPKLKIALFFAMLAFWIPYQFYYFWMYTKFQWVS